MQSEISWWLFGTLGVTVWIFLAWLLLARKQTFDAPLLGLLTVGILLLAVEIVKPASVKFPDGTELKLRVLENQVSSIKEQLRTYALVDVRSGKIIYSNFPEGQFQYTGFEIHKDDMPDVHFLLKTKPRFVEVRSTNGSVVGVSPQAEKDGWFLFEGKYSMGQTDDKTGQVIDQLVIEAYF